MSSEQCQELSELIQLLGSVSPGATDADPGKADNIVVDISQLLSNETSTVHNGKFASFI